MRKITIQIIPALLALLVIGFRYFSQWCIVTSSSCYGTWVHWIYLNFTSPLYFFSIFFLPIALVLVFVPRDIFKSWRKLAVWAIPLAIILIAITPDSNPGAYMDFFQFYRDDAARLAGQVFFAISLVLIIIKASAPRVRLSNEHRYGSLMAPIVASGELSLLFSTIFSLAIVTIGYMEIVKSPVYSLDYGFNLLLVAIITCTASVYYIFATLSRVRQRTGILRRSSFTWHFKVSVLLLAIFISPAVFGFVNM